MAIVEAGSFSQAAKNLKISQATVSRRLQILEQELRITLVIRNTRNFEISTAGQRLYQSIKDQQLNLHKIIDNLRDEQQQVTGRIRVSLPTVLAYTIISPYLAEFMRQNPGIELEVCYQNIELDLIRDNFDLAIVNYRPKQQTVLIRKIYSVVTSLYCTPSYIKRYGRPVSLAGLNIDHLCVGNINFDLTTDRDIYTVHKSGTVVLYPNHGKLFTNNALHNKQIALSGHAIAGGWDDLFAAELKSGQLCRVLPDYSFGEITFYLIRLKNHEKSAITTFIKFLDDCIERAKSQLS
jgi:DNA-binding transcriptional LysR family regulator